jgi:acetyltransferase-like isoleucine patch superfamily enzyme
MSDEIGGEQIAKYFKNRSFLWKGLLSYLAYVTIFPPSLAARIHKWRGVKFEDHKTVYIAPNVLIDSTFPEQVSIRNHVYITRGAKIIAHTTFTRPTQAITGVEYTLGSVLLDEGCYIGVNAVVLPSVTVGKCAIVGAGAVVTKDVAPYAIVAGSPARQIGDVRRLGEGNKASSKGTSLQ